MGSSRTLLEVSVACWDNSVEVEMVIKRYYFVFLISSLFSMTFCKNSAQNDCTRECKQSVNFSSDLGR